jgi:hypothetical protein
MDIEKTGGTFNLKSYGIAVDVEVDIRLPWYASWLAKLGAAMMRAAVGMVRVRERWGVRR